MLQNQNRQLTPGLQDSALHAYIRWQCLYIATQNTVVSTNKVLFSH